MSNEERDRDREAAGLERPEEEGMDKEKDTAQVAQSATDDEWLEALNELEAYERRRERRCAMTPQPVKDNGTNAAQTPTPAHTPLPLELEEEGAARVGTGETPAPIREARMSRYEELCKKPSMTVKSGDLQVMTQLSDILCAIHRAVGKLQNFEKRHGDAIPLRKYRLWEDNLRETATIMLHEFHALRHGKENKTYSKRQVCRICNNVFMVALPDGICDECRSKQHTPKSGEY